MIFAIFANDFFCHLDSHFHVFKFSAIIKLKNAHLSELKAKLQTNPGYHSIEYIEEKLEKKLENIQTKTTLAVQEECLKQYARMHLNLTLTHKTYKHLP